MPVFQVEMWWRCSACQAENLGRFKGCQACGKAKEGEPFYDAPGTAVPSYEQRVTDAALIAQATAGADWACRYCGSHQRRDNGTCAECGAGQGEAARPATYFSSYIGDANRAKAEAASAPPPLPAPPPPAPFVSWFKHYWLLLVVASVVLSIAGGLYLLFRTRVVTAEVVERTWEHKVLVERYMVVEGQGFAESRPASAFEIVPRGQRFHHNDKVRDGTEREAYTERVACGQTCSKTPVSCTTNNNGFKTCSGGDQRCSTKYCSETRYREVPRYKDVPVYREWYTWKNWEWKLHRSVSEVGSFDEPRWPSDAKVALNQGVGPGEKERTRNEAKYHVVFEDREKKLHEYTPKDLEELKRLKKGTQRKVRVGILRETTIEPF
jgi:hypothetical protein